MLFVNYAMIANGFWKEVMPKPIVGRTLAAKFNDYTKNQCFLRLISEKLSKNFFFGGFMS